MSVVVTLNIIFLVCTSLSPTREKSSLFISMLHYILIENRVEAVLCTELLVILTLPPSINTLSFIYVFKGMTLFSSIIHSIIYVNRGSLRGDGTWFFELSFSGLNNNRFQWWSRCLINFFLSNVTWFHLVIQYVTKRSILFS